MSVSDPDVSKVSLVNIDVNLTFYGSQSLRIILIFLLCGRRRRRRLNMQGQDVVEISNCSPLRAFEVKVWKASAWGLSGTWEPADITIDSVGLISIDFTNGSQEVKELGTQECEPYSSISTAYQPSETIVCIKTLENGNLLVDTESGPRLLQLVQFVNKFIKLRNPEKSDEDDANSVNVVSEKSPPPPTPVRPDKQSKTAEVTVTGKLINFITSPLTSLVPRNQPTRPSLPPKPTFLRRGAKPKPLELENNSSLWKKINSLRDDIQYIPAHFSGLLSSIRIGVRLRPTKIEAENKTSATATSKSMTKNKKDLMAAVRGRRIKLKRTGVKFKSENNSKYGAGTAVGSHKEKTSSQSGTHGRDGYGNKDLMESIRRGTQMKKIRPKDKCNKPSAQVCTDESM